MCQLFSTMHVQGGCEFQNSAMRLYCLSDNPSKPCLVLKLPKVTVMLDCALDLTPLLHHLPIPCVESTRLKDLPLWKYRLKSPVGTPGSGHDCLKECFQQVFVDGCPEVLPPEADLLNWSSVDAILISNYQSLLALPYVTETSDFKGAVYATDPTVQLGRLLMEELLEYVARCECDTADGRWKQGDLYREFPNAIEGPPPAAWRPLYTAAQARAALDKIKLVAYREKTDLFGLLRVMAVSSGHAIGSANWLLETDYERFVYMSGSSQLTTHPKPIDTAPIKNADALVLTSLTQASGLHPDQQLGEFCAAVVSTVRSGGNVLVPCYPFGLVYDLFECLSTHLDNAGCSQVPMYFLSPVAESSLALANIYAEWLSDAKQSKVFLPEEPFPHALLVKHGRLKHCTAVYDGLSADFRTPCVMFAGHPSLRFGDAVHFMEVWGGDAKNTVVLVEPDFVHKDVLAPFQPLTMKAVFYPIDTSLDYTQAGKLLKDLKPKRLYLPDVYTKPPAHMPGRTDLTVQYNESDAKVLVFRRNHALQIPLNRRFEKVQVSPELARTIDFRDMGSGVSVSPLLGTMSAYDNHLNIESTSSSECASGKLYPAVYGSYDADALARLLKKHGLVATVTTDATKCIVDLKKEAVTVEVTPSETHVFVNDNTDVSVRQKLIDDILSCLSQV